MRDAESVGALQRDVGSGRTGYEAAVAQPGNHVAHGGKTGAGDGRIFGGVNQFVNAAGIEPFLGTMVAPFSMCQSARGMVVRGPSTWSRTVRRRLGSSGFRTV